MMINKIKYVLVLMLLFSGANAQVSILSLNIQSFQVNPEALLNVNIINNSNEQSVELLTVLSNSNNEMLVTVRSNPFNLRQGLNGATTLKTIKTVDYGTSNQANYIKTSKLLPGGRFKICVTVIASATSEGIDDFCDEIESEFNQYLYLVSPADKDTIDTKYPLLLWNHSEPFSLQAQGEYYRMVVTEIDKEQSAEEALMVNQPTMFKNYLSSHELQYPYDAKELEQNKRYAWQVQKMANGVVVNKSEAFEFILKDKQQSAPVKYAVLKKTVDAAYYRAIDNKIYFRFDESYGGESLKIIIYDSKRNVVEPKVKNDKSNTVSTAKTGYNSFMIDLNELNVSSGYHLLEVCNAKGEKFLLNFLIE